MTQGWSHSRQAFVQHFDGDASNLLMPLVFFVSPTDPRMIKTLEATAKPPEQGGLLYDSLCSPTSPSSAPPTT